MIVKIYSDEGKELLSLKVPENSTIIENTPKKSRKEILNYLPSVRKISAVELIQLVLDKSLKNKYKTSTYRTYQAVVPTLQNFFKLHTANNCDSFNNMTYRQLCHYLDENYAFTTSRMYKGLYKTIIHALVNDPIFSIYNIKKLSDNI